MTPQAQIQAAIECLDSIIAAARSNGPAADRIIADYFRTRRYIGSGDRRAIRAHVWNAVRRFGECPENGRAAMVALAREDEDMAPLFDGSNYGPAPISEDEPAASGPVLPGWLDEKLAHKYSEAERAALLERAPLDIRWHPALGRAETLKGQWPEIEYAGFPPFAARLPSGTAVEQSQLWIDGAVEIQDRGSQIITHICTRLLCAQPKPPRLVIDLCAGAGGKALALAASLPDQCRIIASDIDRRRLSRLEPRQKRAGAKNIESLLLNPGKEIDALAVYSGKADLVLIDAPCSGSGTWRRNPETRWRLTPRRLNRLVQEQARLIELGCTLVKSGGYLVYAVCSLLDDEGRNHHSACLSNGTQCHIDVREMTFADNFTLATGDTAFLELSPARDDTDGFFLAVKHCP